MLINDPIYGFISVPAGLPTEIIEHPWFQRLSRVRQLGMSLLVYPGAAHTRWAHSLGAFHLMHEALRTLQEKGHFLFDVEAEAAECAILLHDIGHGPFSHVLEHTLLPRLSHEDVTCAIMQRLNAEMQGRLAMAIAVFRDEHPKRFLHQLLSSQLDVDRLDYLSRDSFFCGIREAGVGAARIIKMLEAPDEARLVVEEKGMMSVENYLMARRLMYWQVYLHKTVVAAEELLRSALRRARYLSLNGEKLFASTALAYYLTGDVPADALYDAECPALTYYTALDDSDILCALKEWARHKDVILSRLAQDFLSRRLPRAEVFTSEAEATQRMEQLRQEVAARLHSDAQDADYFVTSRRVEKEMYSPSSAGIGILSKDGAVRDVTDLSRILQGSAVEEAEARIYLFAPKTPI